MRERGRCWGLGRAGAGGFRSSQESHQGFALLLMLAEMSFKAALEVISMRGQYFRDIVEHCVEEAGQMAFFVDQGQDAVHSTSYCPERDHLTAKLTAKLEVATGKPLANTRLEMAIKKGKDGGPSDGAATSELLLK